MSDDTNDDLNDDLNSRQHPWLLGLILLWPLVVAAIPFIVLAMISWNN